MARLLSLENRVWFAGILNVVVLFDQLRVLLSTQDSSSLSILMWIGFIYMQATFAEAGYRAKQWGQFWCLAISAAISTLMTVLIFMMR